MAGSRASSTIWSRLAVILGVIIAGTIAVGVFSNSDDSDSNSDSSGSASSSDSSDYRDVDAFSFESMTADYTLGRDADGFAILHTVETFVADFPDIDQNRGIIRNIPAKYGDVDTEVQVRSVTDENGRAVPFTTDSSDGFVDVIVGTDDFVHGRTTYVISYDQRNVIRYFSDTNDDEFYWDVNGTGWAQPFGSVTARLHLADGLDQALNGSASCYRGAEGSTDTCIIERTSDGFQASTADLGPYDNMTIAVGFAPHTFTTPPTARDSWIVTVLPWILGGILLLAVLAVLYLRIFFWRNAQGRGIVIARYEAPEGIGVMQSAHLIGRSAAALPAMIVDVVVQKAATLIEDASKPKDDRYSLELVKPDAIVDSDDRSSMRDLFGSADVGTRLDLDHSEHALGDRLQALVARTSADLTARGFLERKKSKLARWIRLAVFVVASAAVFIGIWSDHNDAGSTGLGWFVFTSVALSILTFGFAGAPERLSRTGAIAREELEGLKLYLRLAEADRLRVLQSPQGAERIDTADGAAIVRLYEKLLPFAIVWGIEAEWAKVLGERYATTPPVDDSMQRLVALSAVNSFSSSFAASSFATTPPPPSSGGSSSFGGSGGGGFSGGGGGGGGGGGR